MHSQFFISFSTDLNNFLISVTLHLTGCLGGGRLIAYVRFNRVEDCSRKYTIGYVDVYIGVISYFK
jgi:hypothetical protein